MFDMTQVIGLYNNDPVSEKYWPLKQIIERLNRSFKGNYKPMTDFGPQADSIAYVELITTYLNVLRPHTSLEKGRIPVQLDALAKGEDMPRKWLLLLDEAQIHLEQKLRTSALSAANSF
ncbi:hypothetical protein IU403_06255 [Aerococcaceae bacterium zg-BR22]|uniref:hypothetical protein n=1 Tax=Aerococcaceae bacterium zg-1292 TaxID=2774330 RepID=UPI0040645B0A|nr:hypothetical protein [Aerococcaceae bacterium zg-BR22]